MGISSESGGPKHEIVMGYPPPPPIYPPSCHPQSHPPSSISSSYLQYKHACAPTPCQYPHGYPSSFQPHHAYPQPYHDYCYQQQYYKVQESRNSAAFGRVMLILMIVVIASMCMMSMVMWFLFGTYMPEFEVKSVKISNFTATNTALKGIWTVEVSISNLNKDLDVNFDHGKSSIFYKDAMLGVSTLKPFNAAKKQEFILHFSMAAGDQKLQSWVLPTLAHDRSNGAVAFSLRLAAEANFTAGDVVYRQESLVVLCDHMQISFSPATGEGTLSPGFPDVCLVRLHQDFDFRYP